MIGLLREPLLQFFVMGSALFALYAWTDAGRGGGDFSGAEIVVDDARVVELESRFRRLWQRPPSQAELQALVDDWIREEILYREGLAMGLERDDPVIRKRVAQKLSFISEDLMTQDTSEAQLEEWFSAHRENYRQETALTFQQILIDDGTDEARAQVAAERLLEALASGSAPNTLGAATLLPDQLVEATTGEIERTFGRELVTALQSVPAGEWYGPVSSAYGTHLVRITARIPGRLLEFAEVRGKVERDLIRDRLDEANEVFMDRLRSRFTITVLSERADSAFAKPAIGDRG